MNSVVEVEAEWPQHLKLVPSNELLSPRTKYGAFSYPFLYKLYTYDFIGL